MEDKWNEPEPIGLDDKDDPAVEQSAMETSGVNGPDGDVKSGVGKIEIEVDAAALEAGFEYPFRLTFYPSKEAKKGDLLEAILDTYIALPGDAGSAPKRAFRRWICKNFNVSEAMFSDPDTLSAEVDAVETRLFAIGDAMPSVEPADDMVQEVSIRDSGEYE